MLMITKAKEIPRPEHMVTWEEKEYFIETRIKANMSRIELFNLYQNNVASFFESKIVMQGDVFYKSYKHGPRRRLSHLDFLINYCLPAIRNTIEFKKPFWEWMRYNNRHIFIEKCLENAKDKCFIKFDVDLKYNVNGMVAEWLDEDGKHKASFAAGPIPARLLLCDEIQFCREVLK